MSDIVNPDDTPGPGGDPDDDPIPPGDIPDLNLWLSSSQGDGLRTKSAAVFTAANSENLSVADNSTLSMGDINMSVWCWVRLTSKPANIMAIVAKWSQVNNLEYQIRWNNTTDRFEFVVSSNGTALGATAIADTFGAPALNTWYMIMCRHDPTANTIDISVNNDTVDSTAHASGIFDGAATFRIGSSSNTGVPELFLDGRVAQVGVTKKKLSAAEVTDLYNAGAGRRYADVLASVKDASLVSWWDLNEESGTRVDMHGSNNLTDNNTVTVDDGVIEQTPKADTRIFRWKDVSPENTANTTQATFTKRPFYRVRDNNCGTHPYIEFDGVDDTLADTGFSSDRAQPYTFVVVCDFPSTTKFDHVFDSASSATKAAVLFINETFNDRLTLFAGSGASNDIKTNVSSPQDTSVCICEFNGASSKFYKDAKAAILDSGTVGTNVFDPKHLRVGTRRDELSTTFYTGDIGEVLFYPRILTQAEREALTRYFQFDHCIPPPPSAVELWLDADDEAEGPRMVTAADFERDNSEFLSRASESNLQTGDIEVTFCAWVYLESKPAGPMTFLSKWGGTQDEYSLGWDNTLDVFRFTVMNGVTPTIVNATTFGAPALATWYFIECAHDPAANTISIRVNGGTADSAAHLGGINSSTGQFRIGARSDGRFWDGRIQGALMIADLLDDSERDNLYNDGDGIDYADSVLFNDPDLRGWWPLDEESGDRRSYVNSLTLTDNATVLAEHGLIWSRPTHGGKVGAWIDKSGNNRHVEMTTHSRKPVFNVEVAQCDIKGVVFNNSTTMASDLNESIMPQPFDILTVAQHTGVDATDSSNANLVYDGNVASPSTGGRAWLSRGTDTAGGDPTKQVAIGVRDTAGSDLKSGDLEIMENRNVYYGRYSGASSAIRVNRSQVASGSLQNDLGVSPGDFRLGMRFHGDDGQALRQHFNGLLHELVVYNHALSNADRNANENYAQNKWACAAPPPPPPPPPPSGLFLWLDASDASTLWQDTGGTVPATAHNDPVARWDDKSGNGNHLTQAIVANQPDIRFRQTQAITREAVFFDGNDFLSRVFSNAPTNYTLMIALADPHSNADQGFFNTRDVANDPNRLTLTFNGTGFFFVVDTTNVSGTSNRTTVSAESATTLITVKGDGTQTHVYTKGVRTAIINHTGQAGFDFIRIGEALGSFYRYEIFEVRLWLSALSDTERESNENGLKTKWGI